MESDKILLLAQLVDSLDEGVKELEGAYKKQDKRRFDEAKEAVLDYQKKIAFLLK